MSGIGLPGRAELGRMVGICSAEYRPSRGQPRCDQHLVEGRWLFRSYLVGRLHLGIISTINAAFPRSLTH